MNKRQIQPIQVWSDEGTISVDALFLKDFYHYHFDEGGGKISYTLGIYQEDYDKIHGILDIPATIIQQWGASDDIIFQYVATTLGLSLV
jgi:hypothetical protein